jgi:ABC-2 type transport system ATP-binding protein
MSSLTTRFREVEVTVGTPAILPGDRGWPANWLNAEVSPSLVRFVDTRFDAESTALKVRRRFAEVLDISARPMPLRTIFLAMARSSRQISNGARA